MSQANVATPRIRIRRGALKIVVFGMPDAGKTSLLGALAQAAQTQDKVLGGSLDDTGNNLSELRRQVYEARPPRPPAELVPYPLTFQPDPTFLPGAGKLDLVFFDCDGRNATEFLGKRGGLLGELDSQLADAMLQSDALLLAVDASARTDILKRDFGQFINFLNLFQESRCDTNEVNGLPVYLVLTKCDLIAEPGDTPSTWMDKIEDRKRKVDQFFRGQLEKEGEEKSWVFGGIDLHVWATAVHRPALASSPARPQEPYQVAELFRQAVGSAVDFHLQRQKAQRKLHLTFGGALGVVVFLALLSLLFFVTREKPEAVQLESSIKSFLTNYNKNSPTRFRQIAEAIPQLDRFRNNDAFSSLPSESKKWVNEELAELHEYKKYDENLKKTTTDPTLVSSEEKLKDLKTKLEELTPPKDYAAGWQETDAVKKRKEWLEDVQAIRLALEDVQGKLDQVLKLAKEVKPDIDAYAKLTTFKEKSKAVEKIEPLQEKVKKLAAELPVRKKDKDINIPGSDRISWEKIFRYSEVDRKYTEWETLEPVVKKPLD